LFKLIFFYETEQAQQDQGRGLNCFNGHKWTFWSLLQI
jgi:hypothetical protein